MALIRAEETAILGMRRVIHSGRVMLVIAVTLTILAMFGLFPILSALGVWLCFPVMYFYTYGLVEEEILSKASSMCEAMRNNYFPSYNSRMLAVDGKDMDLYHHSSYHLALRAVVEEEISRS